MNILFLTKLNLNLFCYFNIGSDTSKTINQFDIKIRICLNILNIMQILFLQWRNFNEKSVLQGVLKPHIFISQSTNSIIYEGANLKTGGANHPQALPPNCAYELRIPSTRKLSLTTIVINCVPNHYYVLYNLSWFCLL